MRKIMIFILGIFLISQVFAACSSGQVDINTASASELDALYGIGPAKAQAIIDYRTNQSFSSVDDLINVNGIGSVTLSDIKAQGLACVSSEIGNKSQETQNTSAPVAKFLQMFLLQTRRTTAQASSSRRLFL